METYSSDGVAKVLVANKVDRKDHKRKVTIEEGHQLAAQLNMQYLEVSAKSGHNITEVFTAILKLIEVDYQNDPKDEDGFLILSNE